MKREYKLARTLGLVVVIFFVCFSPIMVTYVIDYADSTFHIADMTAHILSVRNRFLLNNFDSLALQTVYSRNEVGRHIYPFILCPCCG